MANIAKNILSPVLRLLSSSRRRGLTPEPEREASGIRRLRRVSRSARGFTMMETVLSLGIMAVISVIVVSSLLSRRSQTDLDGTMRQVASLFREAQSRSMAQEGGVSWGVHLENGTNTSFVALYKAPYSSSTIVGYYKIPSDVHLTTSSVPQGSFLEVTFARASGIPSTSTSIGLNLVSGGGGSTNAGVSRVTSGKIFFDDFNRTNL